jgi:hypothetical protein
MSLRSYPLFLVVSAALGVLAGCAGVGSPAEGGPAVAAPTYTVGDRWVYRAQDGFRAPVVWQETREVTAVNANGVTVRVTQKGPSVDNVRTEIWSAPESVMVGAAFDEETRRFATPFVRYDFPLTPGKTWNQRVRNFNEMTKREGEISNYGRVGGWSKVTTPAGTFDVIQVRVLRRLDDDEFWRWPTDCNWLMAYSPAVRGAVREEKEAQYIEKGGPDSIIPIRSQHGVLELMSFTPGKP